MSTPTLRSSAAPRAGLLSTGLLAATLLVGTGTTPAAAAGQCSPDQVTVVVDATRAGGSVRTACTPGDVATGVEALQRAGFTPQRAAAERSGYFVCRIDALPVDEPCQRASPSNAYWSYWHADAGGSWTYSTRGAGVYDPAPGTVQGWAFGAGQPPGTGVPDVRRPAAATPPKAAPAPAPKTAQQAPHTDRRSATDGVTGGGGSAAPTAPDRSGGAAAAPVVPRRSTSSSAVDSGATTAASGSSPGGAVGEGTPPGDTTSDAEAATGPTPPDPEPTADVTADGGAGGGDDQVDPTEDPTPAAAPTARALADESAAGVDTAPTGTTTMWVGLAAVLALAAATSAHLRRRRSRRD